MDNLLFNLSQPEYSYMFGFMQADGNLTALERNRGAMRIEINEQDGHILEVFQKLISVHSLLSIRTRTTNFKKVSTTKTLTVYNKQFRDTIIHYGIPSGKKSDIIKPSIYPYSKYDYWRGIIDADGSLGITANNKPFVSLVTASSDLAAAYSKFIFEVTGYQTHVNRNKRDNVFNIVVINEKCQKIIKLLYYNGAIALQRKKEQSNKILSWQRPIKLKQRTEISQRWPDEDKQLLLKHSISECYVLLSDRTKKSIRAMRDKLAIETRKQDKYD